jgi:hypothetical protein
MRAGLLPVPIATPALADRRSRSGGGVSLMAAHLTLSIVDNLEYTLKALCNTNKFAGICRLGAKVPSLGLSY